MMYSFVSKPMLCEIPYVCAYKNWLHTTGRAHDRFKYEVLSVRVRKGRHIYELLQLGFIYQSIF